MTNHEHTEHIGSLRAYVIGFILSIILTIIPLFLVLNHMMSKTPLMVSILVAAILQFAIQLFFFMHFREGDKPRYNAMALILGLVFAVTLVFGSIWIMEFNSVVQ
jgi:cytochrome o ubiquinol oxidase operon protein cyoD